MKTLKRAMALLLCVVLAVALCGCFGKDEPAPDTTPTTVDVTTTTPSTTTLPTIGEERPFTGYVNASTLRVRPSADTAGEPIGGLSFGDTVNVIGREGDWYKINFKDGVGYVSAQYIQDTVPTEGTAAGTTDTTVADTAAADTTTASAEPTEVVAP